MVRSISGTLTSAINSQTRRPYVALSAQDHINHLQQTLTLSTSDQQNAACVANDGSIIRVSLTRDPSGLQTFNQAFQWQRITDPTSIAQWQNWTSFSGAANGMAQDSGCAVSNSSGVLRAFAQQGTGGNAIRVWTSTDNGQTWSSAPVSVLSPPSSALTKGIASAGNNDVFFLYDVTGGDALGCAFYNGGAWGSLHTWTLPTLSYLGYASGLAVVWNASGSLYTVVYSDCYALHSCTTNSSGTVWTALPDIAPATNQNIMRLAPQIAFFDGLYQLVCIENDNGAYTGTVYRYPRVRQSADLLHWSSGFILHDMSAYYGVCYLKTTPPGGTQARYVAATLMQVELGSGYQQSNPAQYIDLSGAIVQYKRTDEIGKPSTLTVVLDNAGGNLLSAVATYGQTYAPLGINTTLQLGEGYLTGTPPVTPETLTVAMYRVKQLVFERAPGRNQLTVVGEDLTRLLDQANRYQVTYTNQTLAWMIAEICARAGLFNLSLPTTAQMSTSVLTFVLHAGQLYRQALDELCRVGWLEYFLDQNETLQFRELSKADSSVWSYAPEIETLSIGSDDTRANHVIVTGKPPAGSYIGAVTNGEAYDDIHMHATGLERVITASDPKLTTAALCASKAAFILAQEQRSQIAHAVTVPNNPALQLLDPIQLTDQTVPVGTGLSTTARIYRDEVHYQPESGTYEMTLYLEGL
jgi:hypothetical protein